MNRNNAMHPPEMNTATPTGFYQELKSHPTFKSIALLLSLFAATTVVSRTIELSCQLLSSGINPLVFNATLLLDILSLVFLLLIGIKLAKQIWGKVSIVLVSLLILYRIYDIFLFIQFTFSNS